MKAQHIELIDVGSKSGTWHNGRILGAHVPRILSEGDVLHFGSRVSEDQVEPEDFRQFRVERLDQVFQEEASQLHSQIPDTHGEEVIDLTGSDDELEQLSPAARGLPLQRGMQTRSRAAALRQPTAGSAPTRKRRSSPAEERACPEQALDRTSPAKMRKSRGAVEQPALKPPAAEKRWTTAPDQSAPAKRSRTSENNSANGYGKSQSKLPDAFLPAPLLPAAPQPRESATAEAEEQKSLLEDEFTCKICHELTVACHSLVPCGHMFCGECLDKWLAVKENCPTCRAKVTAAPVPSVGIDNFLDSMASRISEADLSERGLRKEAWSRQGGKIKYTPKSRSSTQARADGPRELEQFDWLLFDFPESFRSTETSDQGHYFLHLINEA